MLHCLFENLYLRQTKTEFIANFGIHECITSAQTRTLTRIRDGTSFIFRLILCSMIDNKFITFILYCAINAYYWPFEGRSAHKFEADVIALLLFDLLLVA